MSSKKSPGQQVRRGPWWEQLEGYICKLSLVDKLVLVCDQFVGARRAGDGRALNQKLRMSSLFADGRR